MNSVDAAVPFDVTFSRLAEQARNWKRTKY